MIREITMLEKPEETVAELIQFIRESVRKRGAKGVIVGNSGGVDSAAVIFLAVKALGKNHVRTLYMPERDTAKETARDAMNEETGEMDEGIDHFTVYFRKADIGLKGLYFWVMV